MMCRQARPLGTHALVELDDDLSLLSRQRDQAVDGTTLLGADLAGADFPTLLDTFNDRWVSATAFLSVELLIELLRLTGQWTAALPQMGRFGASYAHGSCVCWRLAPWAAPVT